MRDVILQRIRKPSTILCLVSLSVAAWAVAASREPNAETIAAGREIFLHEWEQDDPLSSAGDGLGPVFNAKSCVACHSQGGIGGGGGNEHNVATFEALPTEDRPGIQGGLIHANAVREDFLESLDSVHSVYPIVPNGVRVIVPGCTTSIRIEDFDPVVVTSVNTPPLFGIREIDAISGTSIRTQSWKQTFDQIADEFHLDFNGTPAGRPRILSGGRVGKFGWKAQFATVEEFVAAACAVEVGLSNPIRRQDAPREHQEDESAALDLDSRQFDALVAFVNSLPAPIQRSDPSDETYYAAERGEALFAKIGCTDCHTRDIGGVAGVYSDFQLHILETDLDAGYRETRELPAPLPTDHPLPNEWKTPPLWGVADSAPYFHDGGSATLEAAILRHKGDARHVTKKYQQLLDSDRESIITFLSTLRAPLSPDLELPSNEPLATSEPVP